MDGEREWKRALCRFSDCKQHKLDMKSHIVEYSIVWNVIYYLELKCRSLDRKTQENISFFIAKEKKKINFQMLNLNVCV